MLWNIASLDPYSLLIADPNRHDAQIIRHILRGSGAREIHDVSDGVQALDLLMTRHMDVAIVAEAMPVLDGIEFARHLRRFGGVGSRRLPIVMTSYRPTRAVVMQAKDAGVQDVLVKPLSTRIVVQRVLRVIEQSFHVALAAPAPMPTGDMGPFAESIDVLI
jgi:CheY-like chemotaxis protein